MKSLHASSTAKALLLLSLLLMAGLLVWSFSSAKPKIHGELAPNDVTAILKAVKSDMWQEVFPDHSWNTVKAAPHGLFGILNSHISEVTLVFDNVAKAKGSFRFKRQGEGWMTLGWDSWTLERRGSNWIVRSHSMKSYDERPLPLVAPPSSTAFSESLSNRAQISFDAPQEESRISLQRR